MFVRRKWLLISFVILLFSSAASASTLLVMGDSLSAAHNLRQESGWVSLLQTQLSQTHPDITVVNASASGETTQGGLSRLPQLLKKHKPSWMILELGANDALRGYPLNQTRLNLETMVKQAHDAGAEVLLIGNHIPQNYGKRYTAMFFELYEKIATEYQLAYVPFMLEGVVLDKNLMQEDGLHPNKQGQPIILNTILPHLQPLL